MAHCLTNSLTKNATYRGYFSQTCHKSPVFFDADSSVGAWDIGAHLPRALPWALTFAHFGAQENGVVVSLS